VYFCLFFFQVCETKQHNTTIMRVLIAAVVLVSTLALVSATSYDMSQSRSFMPRFRQTNAMTARMSLGAGMFMEVGQNFCGSKPCPASFPGGTCNCCGMFNSPNGVPEYKAACPAGFKCQFNSGKGKFDCVKSNDAASQQGNAASAPPAAASTASNTDNDNNAPAPAGKPKQNIIIVKNINVLTKDMRAAEADDVDLGNAQGNNDQDQDQDQAQDDNAQNDDQQ
jgi:hypothetical protein